VVEGKQSDAAPVTSSVQEVTYSKREEAEAPGAVATPSDQAAARNKATSKPAVRKSTPSRTVTY
jgi:hypothetical protein